MKKVWNDIFKPTLEGFSNRVNSVLAGLSEEKLQENWWKRITKWLMGRH